MLGGPATALEAAEKVCVKYYLDKKKECQRYFTHFVYKDDAMCRRN
jgi:hypothetical protein